MLLHLNMSDDRPIYAQIVDQVKFAVASGLLLPGDLVPSVRELSKQLLINPNTVARAYRELQGQQLLGAVRGTGLQVTERAPAHCREERKEIVRARLRQAIDDAWKSDLAPAEIETILHEEWTKSNGADRSAGGRGDQGDRHD